jgi:hypothetical protein
LRQLRGPRPRPACPLPTTATGKNLISPSDRQPGWLIQGFPFPASQDALGSCQNLPSVICMNLNFPTHSIEARGFTPLLRRCR